MGHRALVASRRPDYLYDLRYSHWGADELALSAAITAETPLARGAIDSERLADSVALERVLTEYLDPRGFEALYLVATDFRVTAYRVLWLGWADGRDRGRGAIVAVEPGDRDVEARTWFRAVKSTLADAIEMGVLSRRAAASYLEARVCEDRDGKVYTYDGDREGDQREDVDSGPAFGESHDRSDR